MHQNTNSVQLKDKMFDLRYILSIHDQYYVTNQKKYSSLVVGYTLYRL